MKRIYSGLYVHQSSQPATWAGRALSRHLQWCQQQAIEYTFIASPMNTWAKHAAYPWSWTFGTLVKFEAMRDFLDNSNRGNVFIWMDLDVYPEVNATLEDMSDLGENVLWAGMCRPSFCGYPGIDRNHLNMYCKLIWGKSYTKPEYLALNTGMYSLSRSAVADFWSWLNRYFHIDTSEWWEDYNAKQMKCKEFSAKDGHEVDAFCYGSEETLLEQWLNQSSLKFAPFGCEIHGLYDSGQKHKFTHYYGAAKDKYP